MSKDKENRIWKPVTNTGGFYDVSNEGVVRSWRVMRTSQKRRDEPRILRQSDYGAYKRLELAYPDGPKRVYVHRLVAKAFIPNPECKKYVNHKDGNKGNNHVSNLEWCTFRENTDHAIKNGLTTRGEVNSKSKLTESQVLDIRNAYRLGCFTQKEIADAYNLTRQSVWAIVHNKTWSYL